MNIWNMVWVNDEGVLQTSPEYMIRVYTTIFKFLQNLFVCIHSLHPVNNFSVMS